MITMQIQIGSDLMKNEYKMVICIILLAICIGGIIVSFLKRDNLNFLECVLGAIAWSYIICKNYDKNKK